MQICGVGQTGSSSKKCKWYRWGSDWDGSCCSSWCSRNVACSFHVYCASQVYTWADRWMSNPPQVGCQLWLICHGVEQEEEGLGNLQRMREDHCPRAQPRSTVEYYCILKIWILHVLQEMEPHLWAIGNGCFQTGRRAWCWCRYCGTGEFLYPFPE